MQSDNNITIDIESGTVTGAASSITGHTCVQTTILHHCPANVDMADHLTMQCHILSHHVPRHTVHE